MATMYAQFALKSGAPGLWWDGWIMPFGTRPVRRYRVIVLYNKAPGDPIAWVADPEISRRTWPHHRHLYQHGNVCAFYPADGTWQYGRDDISQFFDQIVLWLGCQIHLEEYGRWPGPEAPGSDLHGPINFRSDDGRLERGAVELRARVGLRTMRLLTPAAGVPLALLEPDDLTTPAPGGPRRATRSKQSTGTRPPRRR